ncbi:MAG: DUF692 domain-containing protein [Vulcanimicrobiota bacterium]
MKSLGFGVSWRAQLALSIERYPRLGFVELMVEHFPSHKPLPQAVRNLLDRGIQTIPHGLSLSLGGAAPPEPRYLAEIESLAQRCDAPLVSEHLAFVRARELESGHLLPVERSQQSLEIVLENLDLAQRALSRPLYIENIATIVDWPDPVWEEVDFLKLLLERSNCGLLLDVSNLYANSRNHGGDPVEFLRRLPLERIGYVHVGGGVEHDGIYHDTHAAPVPPGVVELLEELCALCEPPGVLLERDDEYPGEQEFLEEMDKIEGAVRRGRRRRTEVSA